MMDKLISQQAAIDTVKKRLFETAFNNVGIKQNIDETLADVAENRLGNWFDELPSAQPERLTDDDFETIRIHLNAYKEKLCNQQRWEEAEEYQRIIDRFMAFASAQPDIIRCKDCEFWTKQENSIQGRCALHKMYPSGHWYCGTARRRGEQE